MRVKCIIARLYEPDIAQMYEIDLNQNLINTIRVLCTKYPDSVKFFVPEELFPDIRNGEVIPVVAEFYDAGSENHFSIDPLIVLSEQIRNYEIIYKSTLDQMEIRLQVEGYELPSPKTALVPLSKTDPAKENDELMVSGTNDPVVDNIDEQAEYAAEKDGQVDDADSQSGSNKTGSSEEERATNGGVDQGGDGQGGSTSHSGKIFAIAGIFIAAIIAAVFFFTRDTSAERLEQALSDNDYQTAVTIYNEDILGHTSREKKADSAIETEIDTIVESYLSDTFDFEKADSGLEELSKIQKAEISEKVLNALDEIGLQETSKTEYANGLEYLEKKDYINAIKSFTAVDEKSTVCEEAHKQLKLCVNGLIESVQNTQVEEDFTEGLNRINEAIALLPEDEELLACRDELQAKYDTLLKNNAIQESEELMGKGEHKAALEVIDKVLQILADDPELVEKRNSMVDSIRKEYLDRADAFVKSNEYAKAFQEIQAALGILMDDEALTAKNEEYRNAFVDYIKSQVSSLTADKKYDEALKLLVSAKEIYESPEFDTLYAEVEAQKADALEEMKEYTAPNVEFVTYDGDISGKDDFDEYTITAKREGVYRFDVSDMMSGFEVDIIVYAPDGTNISHSSYGLKTNEGITATLEKDKTYTVKVIHYENEGHYILTIGQQKETIDITNMEIVHDSIEFKEQKNRYDITAKYSGKYRFDLANVYSGFEADIKVFDDHNYDIAHTSYGIGNNQGLSADLEAGRTYRVAVYQYESTSTYDLMIGKQSATQTITSGESITGKITFTDQKNRYDYVADSSDEYEFVLSGMKSGVECDISVFDDHDYRIGYSSYGMQSGGSITATLEKGRKYRIVVYQYASFGEYTLSFSRKQ